MIIIRAGLTGCLAGIINSNARIINPEPEPSFHKAVLRFRSDDISKVTGIPFKKIKVTKHIVSQGRFADPNPMLCNSYSLKVIDGIYNRSIQDLAPVTRWLAPIDFHEQMLELCKERILWNTPISLWDYDDIILSTLPMPEIARMLKIELPSTVVHNNSIYVSTVEVPNCDVHQTIYYPDLYTTVYRATLEGEKLIIESTNEILISDVKEVINNFGIIKYDITEMNYLQKIGKIAPMDDEIRKEFIYKLTSEHGIYSLGRTAIWKNILLDDCLKDIRRINEMIAKSKYDRALGI